MRSTLIASLLTILEERTDEIALLLTDLNMPLMHGKELANRACYLNPNLKVLIMSGFGSSGIEDDWLKEKNAKFIAKPFTKDKLLSYIAETFGEAVSR